MTQKLSPTRPARAAIAAVLALTATPLLAQDNAPAVPVMPQPEATQPAVPTVAPPTVEPMLPSGATVPTPQAAPAMQPPAASLPGTPAPLASPVAPPPVAAVPVTGVAPAADAPTLEAAPATPRVAERQPVRTTAPAPVAAPADAAPADPVTATVTDEAIPAAPIGADTSATGAVASQAMPAPEAAEPAGGEGNGDAWGYLAALLAALGIGGGVVALTRNRKSAQKVEDARATGAPRDMSGIATPPRSAKLVTVPAPAPSPLDMRATPAFAQGAVMPKAPAARMDTARSNASIGDIDMRRLEYMIAQRPSRDNPFLTRPNRKRRAVFLMRQGYMMQRAA